MEVDNKCPLCGKTLQKISQDKPSLKMFEIAHIYPNRPTEREKIILRGCQLLGNNSESFDNKIALCKDCHDNYDFRKTRSQYDKLFNMKVELMKKTAIKDSMFDYSLDEKLLEVIDKLNVIDGTTIALNYIPLDISKKFNNDESLLKDKVQHYVNEYCVFIKEIFKEKEENESFSFDLLASKIKTFF